MKRLTNYIWAAVVFAALCLPVAYAQKQAPPPTAPPASGAGGQNAPAQEPASPVLGMPTTVTGGLAPNVGDSGDVHNQLTFGVQYSELFDSNFANTTGSGGWDEISTFGGQFGITRNGGGRSLSLGYSGGGYVDPKNSGNDSTYQAFSVAEAFQFRRWTLSLVDSFSYLPQSSFGFGAGGGGSSPFLGITLLNPDVAPGQGILSTPANRISNTAFAQVSYAASQRSAWTFGGSYGLLHFINPGYLNSSEIDASVGYNYSITTKDTIGVSYQFDATRFSPALASINNHTISFNYGHHISRQLALQVGAGPQLNDFVPVSGTGSGWHAQWSAAAGLSYVYNRTSLGVSYSHGVSGGSGILLGANTDSVGLAASHPLGRFASISGSFGVSQNSTLAQVSGPGSSYTSEFVNVGFSRMLGTQASMFANYSFSHQNTNAGPCVTAVCGPQFNRSQIFVGLSWSMRPVQLR